jgi:hypothetical protein
MLNFETLYIYLFLEGGLGIELWHNNKPQNLNEVYHYFCYTKKYLSF